MKLSEKQSGLLWIVNKYGSIKRRVILKGGEISTAKSLHRLGLVRVYLCKLHPYCPTHYGDEYWNSSIMRNIYIAEITRKGEEFLEREE